MKTTKTTLQPGMQVDGNTSTKAISTGGMPSRHAGHQGRDNMDKYHVADHTTDHSDGNNGSFHITNHQGGTMTAGQANAARTRLSRHHVCDQAHMATTGPFDCTTAQGGGTAPVGGGHSVMQQSADEMAHINKTYGASMCAPGGKV